MRWLSAVILACGLAGLSASLADGAGVGVRTNVCPDPVQPAITSPANGTVFTQGSITVKGSATGGTLVTVFRNGSDAGSALVGSGGSWSLGISLLPGSNTLVAGTCAPSDPVTVTFDTDKPAPQPGPAPANPEDGRAAPPARPGDAPGQAAPPGQPGSPPSGGDTATRRTGSGTTPLLLISAERSIIRGIVGESLDFPVIVYGGQPPYRATWDWEDGEDTTVTLETARKFAGRHTYTQKGKYQVRATVTDAENQRAEYQFVADVLAKRLPAAGAPSGRPWPAYLAGAGAAVLLSLLLAVLARRRKREPEDPSGA